MTSTTFPQVEQNIARCRVVLSLAALLAVYLDPTQPLMSRWLPLSGGSFTINPYALTVMAAYLCYSLAILYATTAGIGPLGRLGTIATWADVTFGAAIAVFTEGATSPFHAFFAFAVLEAGLRAGLRRTLLITAVSLALYLCLIVVSASGNTNVYIMRPIYLAITGYLVGYLGQQRLNLEAGIRELAAAGQRQRIARDLHDGRAQALAGISLRLETCEQLLLRGSHTQALLELSDLQASVDREYDDLRAYMRSLVGLERAMEGQRRSTDPHFSVNVRFDGHGELVQNALMIVREGVANILRHAGARLATIELEGRHEELCIAIDDDGVGFRTADQQPWSIASLVEELNGRLSVLRDGRKGAHLSIRVPTSSSKEPIDGNANPDLDC